MTKLSIGLIREGKVPIDRRVPLAPQSARRIMDEFPEVEIFCQSSEIRAYTDQEYQDQGIKVVQEVDHCDVLLGVKEVPMDQLIPHKTYFFFSHTIKKQAYNRELLRHILQQNITLIDYECLTDANGRRLLAFGRYAGIVGAYNSIWAYGNRYNLFSLRRASECFDLEDLTTEFDKVQLPKIKIALTGGGRVAKGAMEVLNGMGIRHVSPGHFINRFFEDPVYTQLNSRDYNVPKHGGEFSRQEYFQSPERFQSGFAPFSRHADILIAGAFWDPRAPVLFHREDMMQPHFEIKVIADITCDIEGSIPATKRPSTVDDPLYDYNPSEDQVEPALTDEANVTVMAVDNLPCELPRDASKDFGNDFIEYILPSLLDGDQQDILNRATIANNGGLGTHFQYLEDYVAGTDT